MTPQQIKELAEREYPGKTKKSGSHGVIVRKQREALIRGFALRDSMGWVDVKERNPDADGHYNVTVGFKLNFFTTYCYYSKELKTWYENSLPTKRVLAWQELPAPFKP